MRKIYPLKSVLQTRKNLLRIWIGYSDPDPNLTEPVPDPDLSDRSEVVNLSQLLIHQFPDKKFLSNQIKSTGDQRKKICTPIGT